MYDIAIVGAGPSACGAAIALKKSKRHIVILDKDQFPRFKTCGDAIPGPVLKILKNIAPDFVEKIPDQKNFHKVSSTAFHLPDGKCIKKDWVLDAYNIERIHFDNYLLKYSLSDSNIEFKDQSKVKQIVKSQNGFKLYLEGNRFIESKLLIGADGAQSIVKRTLLKETIGAKSLAVACTAYYKILPIDEKTNYIYFSKSFYPGYFWIFPVGNQRFNVGFGTLASKIISDRVNLKNQFQEFIESDKRLSAIFRDKEKESHLQCWNIPIGWQDYKKCGEGFMLCGDAASLVDPIFGHGIDKAIHSGYLAGLQAAKYFKNNERQVYIDQYQKLLFKEIGKVLRNNFKLYRIMKSKPGLFTWLGNLYLYPGIKKFFVEKLYRGS